MDKVQVFASETTEAGRLLRASEPDWDEVDYRLVDPVNWIHSLTETDKLAIEPFLVNSALEAVSGLFVAMANKDRQAARLAVERLRQSLNDIAEAAEVGATREPAEVVAWIHQLVPDATAAQMGDLVGVVDRTWNRWLQGKAPKVDAVGRVRALAQTLAHLRHAYTSAGCMAWLTRPHPQLDGKTPGEVLAEPMREREVIDLAAGARVQTAA